MYSTRPGLILGFHGTDESIANNIITGRADLTYKKNAHDWLGHGNYFWENSPSRAFDFAKILQANPKRSQTVIKTPAVIGAVLSLGDCLDFTDLGSLQLLKKTYGIIEKTLGKANIPVNKSIEGSDDLLLRELDCLVIETLHKAIRPRKYDSVRGVFWEGKPLYDTAGFREKNHIQLCIINPNCIKGFFLPRKLESGYNKV
jgi:hypothetical protein